MISHHRAALGRPSLHATLHILLAEQDGALRTLLARALRSDELRVTEVADGLALREHLLAAPDDFDLVLSDVGLPGLGGLDVLEECTAAGAAVPTVLLTEASDEHLARRAFRLGAVAMLSKPFPIPDLCIVAEYLARSPRYRRAA